ncbi:hypothetical protein L1987_74543 [Smallanthus sonchifolius]|uniref:Uncharacterized protein n=1 Tax=Smallanthus sonchifolius TaxID=185202 RepID=A0ACB9A413_9ASTR|nr:hypothetical protein L1987_74543 [Smallanthus sonchifolius]
MELPYSDLQKIMSLDIDRHNESESAKILIEALKLKGLSGYEMKKVVDEDPIEMIPIISWELLSKIEKFVITYQNGVQEYLSGDRIVTLVPTDLQALVNFPPKNESKDKLGEFVTKPFFGNEDELDSSDKDDDPIETEVPFAQSNVPISEWFVLSTVKLKLLTLLPMSSETEEGNKLIEKIRQSV